MSRRIHLLQGGLVNYAGRPIGGGGGGEFAPPDLFESDFDNTGADGDWNEWGPDDTFPNAASDTWHHASANGGVGGGRCMYCPMPDVPGAPTVGEPFPSYNRVGPRWSTVSRCFIRFYFRTSTFVTGASGLNIKWVRFIDSGGSVQGGLHGDQPAIWYDEEPADFQAAQVDMGWAWNTMDPTIESLYTGRDPTWEPRNNIGNGQWHWIELEYDRAAPGPGNGYVEYRLWLDGDAMVLPAGGANWGGGSLASIQLVGGNVGTNTPTTFRTPRLGNQSIAGFSFFEQLSSINENWDMYIDKVAASTQRIGPWVP